MYNACGDLKYYSMSRALKSACCLMQEFNMHHGLSHRRCITFFKICSSYTIQTQVIRIVHMHYTHTKTSHLACLRSLANMYSASLHGHAKEVTAAFVQKCKA